MRQHFRKVLQIDTAIQDINGISVKVKTVVWCIPVSFTSRTVKTNHIGISVFIDSGKFHGVTAWMPRKTVSLNLKNPLGSKFFESINVSSSINEAGSKAYRAYILGHESRCNGLTGVVQWFSGDTGSVLVNDQVYRVYACNIVGAKTWYPETACMYLKQGETVTLDLSDMGDHLTCRVTSGGHFDAEKWASLDHSKLAFKCDEQGEAINGLFSEAI